MKAHKQRPNIGDIARPTITQAIVTEIVVRELDNMVTCEVIDHLGNFHKGVETIVQGGGSEASFASPPYSIGQEVYLLQMSHNEPPYIIGAVFKNSGVVPSRNTEYSNNAQDRNVVGVRDYVISNAGNVINLTDAYGAVISANKDIRLQIGAGGILRISKDGLCDDYPIRGVAFITALHNYLEEIRAIQDEVKAMQNDITTALTGLQTALTTFSTNVVAGLPPSNVPGGPEAVVAAGNVLNTALSGLVNSVSGASSKNVTLQALPIRDASTAGQESVETICTSIRLPKAPE